MQIETVTNYLQKYMLVEWKVIFSHLQNQTSILTYKKF